MNKKAQLGLGLIITVFVGIVVALTIYTNGIAPNIGASTLLVTVPNQTVTLGAAGTNTTLNGRQVVGTLLGYNATANATEVFSPSTLTVKNDQVVNGALVAYVTNNNATWSGKNVNLSYVYKPAGYPEDSGSRALIQIIAIFAILAVVAIAVNQVTEGGLFESFRS